MIRTVGPTIAKAEFILKAVATLLYFSISKAAVNSILEDNNLIIAMLRTILSNICNIMNLLLACAQAPMYTLPILSSFIASPVTLV